MSDEEPKRTLTDKLLSPFSDVRNGEGGRALVMLSTIFILLTCYYVLKTVREPLVAASAAQDLQLVANTGLPQWLKDVIIEQEGAQLKAVAAAFQALLLLGFVPAYSWLASKVTRIRLIVGVSIFFIACIELFFLLRLAGVPMLGFFFYIWVGIFSVAMIAQFWSFGNDIYTEDQGKRLFPIIGVGATAGSPVGSKVASLFYGYVAPEADEGEPLVLDGMQQWIADSGIDPSFILLQVPVVLLVVFTVLMVSVAKRADAPVDEPEDGPAPAPTKKSDEGGFSLILKSPYLRLIAAVILLLNVVNTTGELLLTDMVIDAAKAATGSEDGSVYGPWIGQFYGDFFFYVNIIAFFLQAFVVSRIVKFTGLKGILFALPVVALGTYGLFAMGLGLAAVRWAKTGENSTDYSVMNTGKAMVWLPTSRDAKYKGKQAVDTFVVRLGDMLAAIIFLTGTLALGWGIQGLAIVNLLFVAVWLGATFLLVKRYERIAEDPSVDPIATGVGAETSDA